MFLILFKTHLKDAKILSKQSKIKHFYRIRKTMNPDYGVEDSIERIECLNGYAYCHILPEQF